MLQAPVEHSPAYNQVVGYQKGKLHLFQLFRSREKSMRPHLNQEEKGRIQSPGRLIPQPSRDVGCNRAEAFLKGVERGKLLQRLEGIA